MKEKLEILVVEDTPEHLEVAKAFYDTQTDLVVDYATNRKDAISMIDAKKYDGVITDRSIPVDTEVKLDMDWLEVYCKEKGLDRNYFEGHSEIQGRDILIYSAIKEIPCVMHTEHGRSQYFSLDYKHTDKSFLERAHKLVEEITPIMGYPRELWNIIKKDEVVGYFVDGRTLNNTDYLKWGIIDRDSERSLTNLTKKDHESWDLALTYLREEIAKTDKIN